MLAIALPLLLLQVGPNPDPNSIANTLPTSPRVQSEVPVRPRIPDPVRPQCPLGDTQSGTNGDAARIAKEARLRTTITSGADRTAAIHCLAMAQAEQRLWLEAAETFARARGLAGGDRREQARIGGQRGIALVAAGDTLAAALAFQQASDDAIAGGAAPLAAVFIGEHANLLVDAGELAKATQLLADARRAIPGEAQILLLSATLARRKGELADAENFIVQAMTLADDPDATLEAGVIAALDGRDDMARERFRTAVEQSRTGPVANQARAYLDQLAAESGEEIPVAE